MIERLNSLLNIFDVGDLKFFLLVAKKNLKNLLTLSIILSLLVLLISLNQEKKYLSKDLPMPNDRDVEAYISNPRYFAAIRYSGYSNANKIQKHRNELKSILDNNGLDIISDFYVLSYDAPTKFYNRRNEILFEIRYKD